VLGGQGSRDGHRDLTAALGIARTYLDAQGLVAPWEKVT
jgi:hypothetical protein